MAHLGNRFKAVRESKGDTQAATASRLGIASGSLSNIERTGAASPEVINNMCNLYSLSKEWLLNGVGEGPQGVVVPIKQMHDNPWETALVKELKEENERLWQLVDRLTGGGSKAANFHNADGQVGRVKKLHPSVRRAA